MGNSRRDYLMVSPYKEDREELIGLDPRNMTMAQRREGEVAFGWKSSQRQAIRAFCMDCVGEVAAEVRKCTAVRCALWPHRMGTNVLHPKATDSLAPGAAPSLGKEKTMSERFMFFVCGCLMVLVAWQNWQMRQVIEAITNWLIQGTGG